MKVEQTIPTATMLVPDDAAFAASFLEEIYQLAAAGELQGATDKLFETIDRLLLGGAFAACDVILRKVTVQKLPTALMRSFLTITAAAKDKLPARAALYQRVQDELTRLKGPDKAKRLLEQPA